ncbi:MAG: PKD domain-containing protein [Planctomycetota bacterium]|jgi:PKD repeat protein
MEIEGTAKSTFTSGVNIQKSLLTDKVHFDKKSQSKKPYEKCKLSRHWFFMLAFVLFFSFAATNVFADIIVDNDGSGTLSTGTWRVSGGEEPYGTASLWARDQATYTWQFDSQPAGTYEVFMWWTEFSSRYDQVPVDIVHSDGTSTVTVNQQQDGGQWNSLGTYYFDSTGTVTVTADHGSGISTCADAVWFSLLSDNEPPTAYIDSIIPNPADPGQIIEFTGYGTDAEGPVKAYQWESDIDGAISDANSFSTDSLSNGVHTISFSVQDANDIWSEAATEILVVGSLPAEIIIDNLDAETSQVGTWRVSGGADPYAADSVWNRTEGDSFTWHFTPPKTSFYEVSMWWTEFSSRGDNILVNIGNADGIATAYVNQQQNGGEWYFLENYPFEAGQTYDITIVASAYPDSTSADAVRFLEIETAPAADFSAAPTSGILPLTVEFTDQSTGTFDTWQWDFDNDTVIDSTEQDPDYVYDTAGTYTVSLTVSGTEGSDTRTKTDYITVSPPPPPTADFSANTTGGVVPLAVQFTDQSTGGADTWEWDFDNNGSIDSTQQSPSHTYDTVGLYTVTLTVSGPTGSGSETKTDYINVSEIIPPAPIAAFSADTTSGTAPLEVSFTDESGGAIDTWAWDFDNNGSIDSTQQSPSHTYSSAGTYIVTLTVSGLGGSDSVTDIITVDEPAPVAAFSASPTSGTAPLEVSFTDESTGPVDSWAWDFDDNGSIDSTQQSPSHIYGSAGTYTVALTVSGPGGSDSVTDIITVDEPIPAAPVADFSASPTNGLAPLTVNFTDQSTGVIDTWAWDFDEDGTIDSTDQNPSYTYTTPGDYTVDVTLTVSGPGGSDSETKADHITITTTIVLETVIDDGDTETSYTGSWSASSGEDPHDGDSVWSRDGATYTWTFTPAVSGNCELSMWWTEMSSRSSNVQVNIEHQSGETTVYVNQQADGGQWNSLGGYPFEAGTSYDVTTIAQYGTTTTSADAVKFTYMGTGNLAPIAMIESISPAPALSEEPISFTGHGQDTDGTITGCRWRSNLVVGDISNSEVFSTSALPPGVHNITFSVQDNDGQWSADAVQNITVIDGVGEHIYACFGYATSNRKNLTRETLQNLGAYLEGDLWIYKNEIQNKTYIVHFVEDIEGMKEGLTTKDSTVMYYGHSNYGLGPLFATPEEFSRQVIDEFYYLDDPRLFNVSSKWISVSISGMVESQAYPYWWPEFQDGTSAIMPYDFGGPIDPAYNYYITYQIPGDPNHYKLETPRQSAVQRFPDSRKPAWYSINGDVPDPNNPDHRKYYITSPPEWEPEFQMVGDWTPATGYLYNPAGQGDDMAIWNFNVPVTKDYKVFTRWTSSTSRPSDAPYTVNHALGSNTFEMDQRTDGNQWNELGQFHFESVQDWFESRYDDPSLVTLDEEPIGGNSTKKAKFIESLIDNAYLSQEFNPPQSGTFSVEWDVYVDTILNDRSRDRGAMMMVGDDSGSGPNRSGRFVYMGFWCPDGGGDDPSDTMSLVASEYGDSFNYSTQWREVATGLSFDKWYRIKVTCDVVNDIYDVYIDGVLVDAGIASATSRHLLTHVSFAQYNDGAGTFYIDNVATTPAGLLVDGDFNASVDSVDLRENEAPDYSVVLTDDADGGNVVADAILIAGTDSPPHVIQADFYTTNRNPQANQEIRFYDHSTGSISGRLWNFGDGQTSDERRPYHTYELPGTYTVSLTVSGTGGDSTRTKVDYMTVGDPADILQAEYSASSYSGPVPRAVSFRDRSHGDISKGLVYVPDPGFRGVDTFTYTVTDDKGVISNDAVVTVYVGNLPPVANDDSTATDVDTPVTIDVLADDTDSDGTVEPATVVVTTAPDNGGAVVNGDGTISYTPDTAFVGIDTFTYTVDDNESATSNQATVTIYVGNLLPEANDDWTISDPNILVTIDVVANDTDVNGTIDPNSIVITSGPDNGEVEVYSDGTVTYISDEGFAGMDVFTYTVQDNDGAVSNEAMVVINPTNRTPVANDDSADTYEDIPVLIDVVDNDTDEDDNIDSATITVVSLPVGGEVLIHTNGTLTYIPDTAFVGVDTFVYTVADDEGAVSNEATVTVQVGNLSPTAKDDSATTSEGVSVVINVVGNDSDSDGSVDQSTVVTTAPANGTVTVLDPWFWDFGDGQVSHEQRPVHTYLTPGNYTVTLTVSDVDGVSVIETKQNLVRATDYEDTVDTEDYPKAHFGSKTLLYRNEIELAPEEFKYARMFFLSCNSGSYYTDTFHRGVMIYTTTDSEMSGDTGFSLYLNAYLQGMSDQEIYQILQAKKAQFDYYDFNKYPWQQ